MDKRNEFYRKLRESVGTQSEVSVLLGVHVRTIDRREKGLSDVTDEMVAALEFFKTRGKK